MDPETITKELLELFENLKEKEWKIKVNKNWTIKDVLAHLVGWEKESVFTLEKEWKTKKLPWFFENLDYTEFNKKSIEEYKSLTPKELIKELRHWQRELDKKINEIGEQNLRKNPELFSWVFGEGEDNHYLEHLNQIKKVLKK